MKPESIQKLFGQGFVRYGLPAVGTLGLVLLATRKSSDPVLFGRYSGTAILFLVTLVIFLFTLWKVCLRRAVYSRLVTRLAERPRVLMTWLVMLVLAGVAFALRWNFLTPILVLALAVNLSIQSADDLQAARRTFRKQLALSIFSILFTLILVEVACRVIGVPFEVEFHMYYEPDPHTGYSHRPNSVGRYQEGIEARVNAHGFRDDEVTEAKAEGVYRIVVVGDSFTMGYNVAQDEGYPQVLEQLLNEKQDRKVEVINTGVSGWGPFQYAESFIHKGVRFNPDLVVVGYYMANDAYQQITEVSQCNTAVDGRRISRTKAEEKRAEVRTKLFLYEHVSLARAVMNKSKMVSGIKVDHFYRDHCEDFTEKVLANSRFHLEKHLPEDEERKALLMNGINQLSRAKSASEAPMLVLLIPTEIQINSKLQARVLQPGEAMAYDLDMPQKILTQLFADKGIATLDVLEDFRSPAECWYMNDLHWHAVGHRLAAEKLADRILPLISPP